jgi:metal-responsive CopG/Arc/MetJ family transcriptional regulator
MDKVSKQWLKARRVSLDFPEWMVEELDSFAQNLGITRKSLIKVFISDKLKKTY